MLDTITRAPSVWTSGSAPSRFGAQSMQVFASLGIAVDVCGALSHPRSESLHLVSSAIEALETEPDGACWDLDLPIPTTRTSRAATLGTLRVVHNALVSKLSS